MLISNLQPMSAIDEEFSDDESLYDKASEVFLGYTDVAFDEEDEEPTLEDTFIGGQPIWLHEDSSPAEKDLKCDNCNEFMALLLQASAPRDDKPYDRVLYIFACKNTQVCSRKKGSIKAIRGVCKDPERMAEIKAEQDAEVQKLLDEKLRIENKKKLQIEMTKDIFDATKPSTLTNPFGGNSFGGNPFGGNPFGGQETKSKVDDKKAPAQEAKQSKQELTYAAVLAKAAPKKEPVKKLSAGSVLPQYPGFFLFTEQEQLKKVTHEPELEKYKELIDKMDPNEDQRERSMSNSSATSSSGLNPETSKIASMLSDAFFENFSSIVGHNPSQVLRYDLGGEPLLYSGKDDVAKTFKSSGLPSPAYNPSSERQFELQLMPKAIMDLELYLSKLVKDILGGMAWGTIIVATDIDDGVSLLDENHVGYVVEYCGVQWEESV
ncbi:hypothetical protein PUMCH_000104 [Australozyma saopauloensis]|uniref:Programmed cell death protein 2 C-terminal domain-containing protein n=1 Tax=Australozyma saopauloensis TaxID=291208 RepID=A0AAX4H306_9ASCO|nr:hypothetical protein PUMCH_000104 [[Candida] saopauloensis]